MLQAGDGVSGQCPGRKGPGVLSSETAYLKDTLKEAGQGNARLFLKHVVLKKTLLVVQKAERTFKLVLFHQLNCASRALRDSQHGWSSYLWTPENKTIYVISSNLDWY